MMEPTDAQMQGEWVQLVLSSHPDDTSSCNPNSRMTLEDMSSELPKAQADFAGLGIPQTTPYQPPHAILRNLLIPHPRVLPTGWVGKHLEIC